MSITLGKDQTLRRIKRLLARTCLPLSCVIVLLVSTDTIVNAQAENYALSKRDFIFALHFQDENSGWCVGNKGLVLKTTNAGTTWQKIPTETDNAFNDITFSGNDGWIVGQRGMVLHTADRGATWKNQNTGTDLSLMQVCFTDNMHGFIVGEGGTVLSTSDGGSSWTSLDLDWLSLLPQELIEIGVVVANLYDVSFIDADNGWIVGDNGIVLATRDGAKSWNLLRAGQLPPLFSVCFTSVNEGWATGQDGLLLLTRDGGNTWDIVELPVRPSLFRIRMRGQCGIVVGNGGVLARTSDGGLSWEQMKLDLSLPYPWFGDAWILGEDPSTTEIVLVGKAVIKKVACSDKWLPRKGIGNDKKIQ